MDGIADVVKTANAIDNVTDVAKVAGNAGDAIGDAAKIGWKVGDDITNLTKAGKIPS